MSRPGGPEGAPQDLGGKVAKIMQLRDQVGLTDLAYRQAVENRVQSLKSRYSHPDIVSIIDTARTIHIGTRDTNTGEWPYMFPPRIDNPFYRQSKFQHQFGPQLNLNSHAINNKHGFYLELSFYSGDYSHIAPGNLNEYLKLDSATFWEPWNSMPNFKAYRKLLTTQDFVNHPEWLEILDQTLYACVDAVYEQTRTQVRTNEAKIQRVTGMPIEQVVQDLRTKSASYTPGELLLASQDAAETALENAKGNTPKLLPPEHEAYVRVIVTQMIEERLTALQLAPERQVVALPSSQIEEQVHQIAQGDPIAESIMRRFVRRSRDPQKVTQALIAFSGVIPGVEKLRALLEAINVMFGPEERSR